MKPESDLAEIAADEDADVEHLGDEIARNLGRYTIERWQDFGLHNAEYNRRYLSQGQSIAALRNKEIGTGDAAIVFGAGPSIAVQQAAKQIRESNFDGAIVATDQGLKYCLPHGLVPDLVVNVDPRPRMRRWFGFPRMSRAEIDAEDYYRVKDIDPFFDVEVKTEDPMRDLIERYGPQMRIALPTVAYHTTVERVLEVGMDVYWWNPMYDDPDEPDSITRKLQAENRLPSINAGGNVGTACWMMAHAVLGKSAVAIIGMDFSVPDGTPIEQIPHYATCRNLMGDGDVGQLVRRIHNPHNDQWYMTDPTYLWYRMAFMELASETDVRTVNCTEGGILFGDGIEFTSLSAFLSEFG